MKFRQSPKEKIPLPPVIERGLAAHAQKLRNYFLHLVGGLAVSPGLERVLRYALERPGKGVRSWLLLHLAPQKGAFFAGVALELVHTYSLIHDDLPSMDNAPRRRGAPSLHALFGEANAILAGDALLALAFQCLASRDTLGAIEKTIQLQLVTHLAQMAGPEFLVDGQYLDLCGMRTTASVANMYVKKTGSLFRAAGAMAAVLEGINVHPWETFGEKLGISYQLQDDWLNLVGEEEKVGKPLGQRSSIPWHLQDLNQRRLEAFREVQCMREHLFPNDRELGDFVLYLHHRTR